MTTTTKRNILLSFVLAAACASQAQAQGATPDLRFQIKLLNSLSVYLESKEAALVTSELARPLASAADLCESRGALHDDCVQTLRALSTRAEAVLPGLAPLISESSNGIFLEVMKTQRELQESLGWSPDLRSHYVERFSADLARSLERASSWGNASDNALAQQLRYDLLQMAQNAHDGDSAEVVMQASHEVEKLDPVFDKLRQGIEPSAPAEALELQILWESLESFVSQRRTP